MDARQIAENILGQIEWIHTDMGYCDCPGLDLHTNRNGPRDCRVMLNGAPTIHCVHASCSGAVASANHRLRSEIGKTERGERPTSWRPRRATAEEIQRRREAETRRQLEIRARASLDWIVERYAEEPVDFFESSPVRLLDDPWEDWRLLLALFPSDGMVWIGDTKDSCPQKSDAARKAYCQTHFRPVWTWLKEERAPGQFTCASVFKPGIHSRSNENVLSHPFLVVESDHLEKPAMLAVFKWMQQFMRLRAVVDTAGKSLHGWFDYPEREACDELRVILPALECDPKLFTHSQPCRLPGARRGDKVQCLLWLDLGDSR